MLVLYAATASSPVTNKSFTSSGIAHSLIKVQAKIALVAANLIFLLGLSPD
jgi:hypothetical protein